MRAKSLMLLMLALGCGLVASIGITQVMANRGKHTSPTPAADAATIFVALEDIPTGDPITPQLIKLEQWPKDKVPPGALTKLEDVENRRPKTKIYKGAPLLENQLLPKGANQGATAQIPKGYRVVAVKVDDVSASSSMIRPGDRVDVLVHVQRNPSKGIDATKTQTILEDIKVFAVNDVYDMDTTGAEKKIAAKTISLLVTPPQAERVTLAAEMGKLRMIMRSYEDDTQVNSDGAVPEDLFGNADGADRSKDDPVTPSQPVAKQDKANDFVDFLKSKQTELPAVVEGPQEPSNWKMRVITAAQVNDVILQVSERPGAGGAATTPTQWKATSSVPESRPGNALPSAQSPQAAPPAPTTPTQDEQLPAHDNDY